MIREWDAYWILWGLVIFEFSIGQGWRRGCLDCETEVSRLRSAQQLQSSLSKSEHPACGDVATQIGSTASVNFAGGSLIFGTLEAQKWDKSTANLHLSFLWGI